jgi:hypothetical protein
MARGGGKKGVKNRAAQSGFGELREQWLKVRRDHQDTLGLQGAADSGEGYGEIALKEGLGFVGVSARFGRAFEEVGEDEAALLEFGKDFFGGSPCRGDAKSAEENAGWASKARVGGIQKVCVSFGSGSGEQEGLDVDGAETRGPFEALQAASDMLGGSELSAAIARQKCGNAHIQK